MLYISKQKNNIFKKNILQQNLQKKEKEKQKFNNYNPPKFRLI